VNKKIEVGRPYQLNEDAFLIQYKEKPEFIRENDSSNHVLALYVTSAGRRELYGHMKKIIEYGGAYRINKLIYYDTDSCAYLYHHAWPADDQSEKGR